MNSFDSLSKSVIIKTPLLALLMMPSWIPPLSATPSNVASVILVILVAFGAVSSMSKVKGLFDFVKRQVVVHVVEQHDLVE